MEKIENLHSKKLGKIYQITKKCSNHDGMFKIQTHGIKKPGHVACPNPQYLKAELKKILTHKIFTAILIDSIETFHYDKKLIILFKYMNVHGIDVYLKTTENKNIWYVDKKLV